MAPKKTGNTGDETSTMTEGEVKFVKALFDNMVTKPDADWDRIAEELGLKDSKCAKERFRQMSVRHGWGQGAKAKSGATTPAKVAKPKTPRKTPVKKARPVLKAESDDGEDKDISTDFGAATTTSTGTGVAADTADVAGMSIDEC